MIILDANVLIYAYHPGSPHHSRCRAWVEDALNGSEQVGIPWQTILAFVRIMTNPRVFERPLSSAEVCEAVSTWLACPQVLVVEPGMRFWSTFVEQMAAGQVSGPLVTDCALASLAIEHGARLCTTDRDFTRFRALRVIDPLQ